jgi:hypothetical protein
MLFDFPALDDPRVVDKEFLTPERYAAIDPASDPMVQRLSTITDAKTLQCGDWFPYVFWIPNRGTSWLTLDAAQRFTSGPITTVFVFRARFSPDDASHSLIDAVARVHTTFVKTLLATRTRSVTLVSVDLHHIVTHTSTLVMNTLLFESSYVQKGIYAPREDRLSIPCQGDESNSAVHALLGACVDMMHTAHGSDAVTLVTRCQDDAFRRFLVCLDYINDQFRFPSTVIDIFKSFTAFHEDPPGCAREEEHSVDGSTTRGARKVSL